ncbi:MAG: peptidase S10 [bacterium]|nr:peptidase S10 [bacterium]
MTEESEPNPAAPVEPFPTPKFQTVHTLKLADSDLDFQAEAGWISLRKIHTPRAHMFYTAYLAEPPKNKPRPLTFVFNGGPGAASAFLHMGSLGPQRVAFGPNGTIPASPTQVVANQETWLPFTDLVFIDPVGTGFSRALKEKPASGDSKNDDASDDENPEYWEVETDLDSLGEFIQRFLSKHHRWTSPIFLAGESYGGFRVAKMARRLQEKHGVGLCGSMLISPAIEFASIFGSDYDLGHWIELFPSLAASAFAHQRARNVPEKSTAAQILARAEKFAMTDLAKLLAHGELLEATERNRIFGVMSDLTGMPVAVIEKAGGRLDSTTFCRELLRDERRLLGRYDAAISVVDPFPDRPNYEGPDPTLLSIDRLFGAAINDHLRAALKVETELDYRLLSHEVFQGWKDRTQSGAFRGSTGAMDDLRYGMSLNEHMKVMITHGRYDLITPYFSSRRLIELMKLTEGQRENMTFKQYSGGHMYYSWDESREAFLTDTRAFYDSAIPDGI